VDEYLQGFPDYARRHDELKDLLLEIHPYTLTYAIAERYGQLRRMLRPPYGPGMIGDSDTLVAATALEYGLTLVTTDNDFTRVPSLRLHLISRESLRGQNP
jgi:predicted nucleic acid-binding protein